MTKKTLTAKLSPKNLNRLENYADREGISKSEATDRLVKQGLDVEESDMRLVPVKADGGTIIEDRLDEIEKSQQDQLNQLDQKVDSLSEQPSAVEELTAQARLWSFGFVLAGGIVGILASLSLVSIDVGLIAAFTIISAVIFGVSSFVRNSIQNTVGFP